MRIPVAGGELGASSNVRRGGPPPRTKPRRFTKSATFGHRTGAKILPRFGHLGYYLFRFVRSTNLASDTRSAEALGQRPVKIPRQAEDERREFLYVSEA